MAAGATQDWWSAVRDDLGRREYEVAQTPTGLRAPNRAQNLRTRFDGSGIEVMSRSAEEHAAWRLGWRTVRWGRSAAIQDVAVAAEPTANGARVVYERGALTEWYENRREGLEQGFTVRERPAGAGELRVVGETDGGLHPELASDGGAVDFFDASGARVLRYGALRVEDARGRGVPSRFELTGSEIALVMDDAGAEYPLNVDPLLSSPSWTAEGSQSGELFGISVSTAGDVNGDGYSDVLVGSYGYDALPVLDVGRVSLYAGSASGLSLTPAWTVEGDQSMTYFGRPAGPAGDVNGDGFDDIIVGAGWYSNGEPREGRAYVFLGSASWPSTTPSWTAEADQDSAVFGGSVATAGDVNGDGYSDVIIGAPLYDNGETNEGRAFVYLGSASGLAASPAWTAESDKAGAKFGDAVATAGDVNGDGYADVVVGAPDYDKLGSRNGRAYVYLGSPSGPAATPVWTVQSTIFGSDLGVAVSTAGDVNGDGYADVLVGDDTTREAFLYLGSASGPAVGASWTASNATFGSGFGRWLGPAGDVNGDGYADVVIGAYGEDEVYLYPGSATGLASSPSWTAVGDQSGAWFGVVATAGDVNGDGFSDIIVGAPFYDVTTSTEGRAYVYNGSADGLAADPSWTAVGDEVGSQFGYSASTAGDVNGDGFSDVILGAPSYDNGQVAGRAFVYLGSSAGLGASPAWTMDGDQDGAQFGFSVATAGDVNGDGYSDVVIGAPNYDNGETAEGRVYVYLGSATGPAASPATVSEIDQAHAGLGFAVAAAGDVNGDGYSDLIVGADGRGVVLWDVYVYLGSPSGPEPAPAWSTSGDPSFTHLYFSLGTAGDVNGDGYSDVIIGDAVYNLGAGKVSVYQGSPAGLDSIPAWTEEGVASNENFGFVVGTAGDVNADGNSDIIIGSPYYDDGAFFTGRAWVYPGSPSGVFSFPMWEVGGFDSYFGLAVATAGDVNGDGYSDFVVKATFLHYLYLGGGGVLGTTPASTIGPGVTFTDQIVVTAGDVNGDGYADILVSEPGTSSGTAYLFYGNSADSTSAGLTYSARQRRTDDSAPIAVLGWSDSQSAFLAKVTGRTPAGRGNVRLEVQAQPLHTPVTGSSVTTGPWTDTGAPSGSGSAVELSELIGGLTPATLYHWRLRLAGDSPFFPHTRWMFLPDNGLGEADFRTGAGATTDAPAVASSAAGTLLDPASPNPFADSARLSFALPRRGPARLAVYDVSGREVATLFDGVTDAGRHVAEWNGRDSGGRAVAAGVYFARLTFDGTTDVRKIVRIR